MRTRARRATRRVIASITAVVAASTFLAACGGSAGSAGSSQAVIKWAVTSPIPAWDPVVSGATGATQWLSTVYSSLFTLDEQGTPQPALAQGWEYNAAGDQITITLKPDLTFQDGSPIDAEAVAYNIDRIKSQDNSALKGSYNNIESATVVDPLTVRLDLAQTDYQVPLLLSNRAGLLASKKAAETDVKLLNSKAPVGAGPFKVVEFVPESHIYLEKWDGYWDAKDIHVDRIELQLGIDPTSVVAGLQSGVYNFASNFGNADIERARKAGFDVVTDTKAAWVSFFLSLNLNQAPFDDPAVVEAVQYAIDRDEFVKKLTFGTGEPAEQPFPSTHKAYNTELEGRYAYDPAKARQILADAGYQDGDIRFDLVGQKGADEGKAEILQQQLAAVGITTEINIPEQSSYIKSYYGKELPFAFYGYVGRDSPVQALTEHFDAGGIANLSSPQTSPEFQAALAKVRSTPIDAPDYEANLKAATKAGYEHGSTISLYSSPQAYVKDPAISDLRKIDGVLSWKGVTIGDQ